MACPLSTLISPLCGTGISTRNAHLYFTPSSFTRYQRRYCFDPFQSHNSRERGKYTLKSGGTLAVRASLADFDGHVQATSQFLSTGLPQLMEKAEGLLYTIADAAVSVDSAATETVQKTNRDWLSGLTDVLESILKVLKDGLQALHVPYSYGFAIILLTILVKAATFPLSKQQVESSLAMQNLAPKIKAIQQRYAGDQERIQLETARLYKQAGVNPLAGCLPTLATIPVWIGLYRALSNVANEGLLTEGFFWIPSLSGPTTIAARQSGSGISWLFPFVDGAPPLGWGDTAAYLVLPLLLVISQYVSMQLMQTPQSNDPSQKNTQAILKFLPLMIGYFSLSVPSGLSLYWLTNNILSTGQQLLLRRGNNSKGPTSVDGGEIISAGQALRSSAPAPVVEKKDTRGERFRQLKMEEARKKAERAEASRKGTESPAGVSASETPAYVTSDNERDSGTDNEGDETDEETTELSSAKDSLEEIYSRSESSDSKQGKRSKRKRVLVLLYMADSIPSKVPDGQSEDEVRGAAPSGSEFDTQLVGSSDGSEGDGGRVAESSGGGDQGAEAGGSSGNGSDDVKGGQDSEESGELEVGEEEEESGECGFCLFMKSGPCRDSFIEWEECVEQAEKDKEDMVEKCHKVTFLLKECMEKYSDYYEPVLQAERAMNDEAEAEAAASVAVSDQDSEERESTFENPSSSEDVGQLAERVDSVLLSSEGPPSE